MIFTKEEFKKLWESNADGDGITNDDIADCAKDWGLFNNPRTHHIYKVQLAVLKSANVIDPTYTDRLAEEIERTEGYDSETN